MTWSRDEALTFAHHVIAESDPNKSGTIRLARALIDAHDECVRLRISEDDRRVLLVFAADRSSAIYYPETVLAIERVLAKYEAL